MGTFLLIPILISTIVIITESASPLRIDPSFLLLDEDWDPSNPLRISICPFNAKIINGDPTNTFSVIKLNSTCSTLKLNRPLDADTERSDGSRWESFSLVLSGPRKARATLEIQVVDVNDNAPVFINPPNTITISESTEVGEALQKIRTRDPDTGVGGIARYTIKGSDLLSVDKRKCNNGECWTTIRLKKKLEANINKNFDIDILASDGDPHTNRTNTATHRITVHVNGFTTTTAPIWTTDLSKTYKLSEDAAVGAEIIKVLAKGSSDEIRIKYEMAENDYLRIDEKTGSVTLKKKPTRQMEMTISITASEGSSRTDGELKITYTTKKTDNQIETSSNLCQSEAYNARIAEGSKSFETDLVLQLTKEMPYSSLTIEDPSNAFAIEKSSGSGKSVRIKIINPELIDYEKAQKMQFFISSSSGRCRVDVEVLDENDNAPKFTHDSFLFYVTENHKPSVLGEVKASDADSSLYLPIRYSILGDAASSFAISENGELRSLFPVDREKNDKFDLVIRATDAKGKWTDCPGKVVVRDINDNSPQFDKQQYIIEIDEEKSLKQKINVSDPDLGPNGQITLTIDEIPDGIPIDVSAGILFIGKLDRDTMENDRITLVLRATDGGTPPRSSTANLTVIVRDINDNWPAFSNSQYSIVVDANISPGGVIGSVKAEDADATSPNNYIHYSTDDSRFRVTDQGELIYSHTEVLSKDASMELRVTAMDGGIPSHNSTAKVVINEHKRGMQSELTTELVGNETVRRAEVKWANSGMVGYTYEIMKATAVGYKDSEVRSWVSIDQNTGIIHTLKALSPEKVKQIRLYISMRKGKREVPVELIIKVVDNSDTSPFFKKDIYRAVVSEDVRVGSKIMEVKASGGDENSEIRYSLIILSGPRDSLGIDTNGIIRHRGGLDYEKTRIILGKVIAEDNQQSIATTNFSITLTDANDNRPIFKNGSVFTSILAESSKVGTVLDLPYPLATDADSGKFGELVYSLITGDGFEIDSRTSQIRLTSTLDYESQKTHSLTLKCTDNTGESQSHEVFATVTVMVTDDNDHRPILHNADLQHLTVSEDSSIGSTITVLSVTDADQGGQQTISLNANHSLFRVDDEKKMVVASTLTGYAGERICSSLIATDGGSPPLSVSFPYCVTVYPATNNHHNPLIVFPKPNSIHYFDENVQYDELLRIKLLEEEDMKGITYNLDTTFKKDWEGFIMSPTGVLSAKAAFDFEKKTVHEVKIRACRVSNCSSVHVFLSVNDRNDNCPIFPKQDVRLFVTENDRSPPPRQIGRVPVALDADFHSDNTKVCYTTESSIFFFLDPTLPVLYTNSSFDREQMKEHTVNMIAYDCLLSCRDPHKPTNGSLIGTIIVKDVNDNFPAFSEKMYAATVIQSQIVPGSILTTVKANDLDEEPQGLKYSIKGVVRTAKQSYSVHDSPLSIDRISGEVSANDILREPSYTLTVAVVDGVGHEDTATLVISVVTYSQQTELLFDAPFEFIVRHEKQIVSLLSNATSLTAVIDRCRQNSNFTLVLAHFLDRDEQFVEVDEAISLLMSSNSSARRELRNSYGLREAVAPVITKGKTIELIAVGCASALLILLVLFMCIWCRQRNNYASKLRQISQQAAVHTATLQRTQHHKKLTPYMVETIGPLEIANNNRMMAPPPPLQSTEL